MLIKQSNIQDNRQVAYDVNYCRIVEENRALYLLCALVSLIVGLSLIGAPHSYLTGRAREEDVCGRWWPIPIHLLLFSPPSSLSFKSPCSSSLLQTAEKLVVVKEEAASCEKSVAIVSA